MIYTTSADLSRLARPGDIVYFHAKANPLSLLIELFTFSAVSHCAVVESVRPYGGSTGCVNCADVFGDGERTTCTGDCVHRVRLFESTILRGVNGCQFSWADQRLVDYAGGCAWLGTLSDDARKRFDQAKFSSFLASAIGRKYDAFGLLEVLGHDLTKVRLKEDAEMFCSAAVTAAYEASGVFNSTIDYAEISPQWLVEQPIYNNLYQILGKQKQLRRFNGQR